jgi:hypothetical protein
MRGRRVEGRKPRRTPARRVQRKRVRSNSAHMTNTASKFSINSAGVRSVHLTVIWRGFPRVPRLGLALRPAS